MRQYVVCSSVRETLRYDFHTGQSTAKVLVEQVFNRFGTPLSILSDRGKEVDGLIMNEVCSLFGVTKLHTTPYKPSTNQVERFHRTMNSILAKTVSIGASSGNNSSRPKSSIISLISCSNTSSDTSKYSFSLEDCSSSGGLL